MIELKKLYKEETKLYKKIVRLETYLTELGVCKADEIGMVQQYMLNIQLSAMKTYHSVLVTRIDFLESTKSGDITMTQYEDFVKEYIKKQA